MYTKSKINKKINEQQQFKNSLDYINLNVKL